MKGRHLLYHKFFILFVLIYFQNIYSKEVEISENLSGYIPKDISLINEYGDTVNIINEIEIPTLISFVYYNCNNLCNELLEEISSIIDKTELELGKDYQVFTISINPINNTEQSLHIKDSITDNMIKKERAKKYWKFLTGDSLNISKITRSVGYKYQKTNNNDFIHKMCLIVLNQQGKICRYNHGINMLPLELKISIQEAGNGNTMPSLYKKDEYCYPHVADSYSRLHKMTKIYGFIILSLAIFLFLYLIIKPKINRN